MLRWTSGKQAELAVWGVVDRWKNQTMQQILGWGLASSQSLLLGGPESGKVDGGTLAVGRDTTLVPEGSTAGPP